MNLRYCSHWDWCRARVFQRCYLSFRCESELESDSSSSSSSSSRVIFGIPFFPFNSALFMIYAGPAISFWC